jgi:hypothetical protein
MLLSNNSKPWGRPENLTNMVDLFYFSKFIPTNLVGSKAL